MFLGMLQFYFAQNIFGKIGLSPNKTRGLTENDEDQKIDNEPLGGLPKKIVRDRLIVIGVFSFFVIFFWWAFEQAGGSMTIFAADYTDRLLVGGDALTFKILNTLLTVIPMLILTWVLLILFRQTFSSFASSNIFLGLSFVIIWIVVIWMLERELRSESTEVPASWFGILNYFYIMLLPLISKIWQSKFNPTGPKICHCLNTHGVGFAILSYGLIFMGAQT